MTGVRSPSLNEGSQLILKVFGLLSRQSRHRICSAETLSRQPMTGFAILDLGVKVLTRYDAALYRSKSGGRNLVSTHAGPPDSRERGETVGSLSDALRR